VNLKRQLQNQKGMVKLHTYQAHIVIRSWHYFTFRYYTM